MDRVISKPRKKNPCKKRVECILNSKASKTKGEVGRLGQVRLGYWPLIKENFNFNDTGNKRQLVVRRCHSSVKAQTLYCVESVCL